jgi:hypothetical protein
MPRTLAMQLLHAAQIAGDKAEGLVAARTHPDRFYEGPWREALPRAQAEQRQPWAVFFYRAGAPEAPSVGDFAEQPQLLRLTVSLATKGVLQLHAWHCTAGRVEEREMRIED